MIIKKSGVRSSRAKPVAQLADYLLHGTKDARVPTSVRCKYLFTSDPDEKNLKMVAAEMIYNNERSSSTCNKHEHFIFSLTPGEHLDQKQWQSVIDTFMSEVKDRKGYGYEGMMYFAAVHKDTDHEHMHLVVSLIDPKTATRQAVWNTKRLCQKIAAKLNKELGLSDSWSNANRRPEHVQEQAQRQALAVERWTGKEVFLTYMTRLKAELKKAQSWAQFLTVLNEHGVKMQAKGQGLVFVSEDGKAACKASLVDRKFSKKALTELFGKMPDFEYTTTSTKTCYRAKAVEKVHRRSSEEKIDYWLKQISSRGDDVEYRQHYILAHVYRDPRTIYDMLKVAREKWGESLEITGDQKFKQRIISAAVRLGMRELTFTGDLAMQRRYRLALSSMPPKDQEKIAAASRLEAEARSSRANTAAEEQGQDVNQAALPEQKGQTAETGQTQTQQERQTPIPQFYEGQSQQTERSQGVPAPEHGNDEEDQEQEADAYAQMPPLPSPADLPEDGRYFVRGSGFELWRLQKQLDGMGVPYEVIDQDENGNALSIAVADEARAFSGDALDAVIDGSLLVAEYSNEDGYKSERLSAEELSEQVAIAEREALEELKTQRPQPEAHQQTQRSRGHGRR